VSGPTRSRVRWTRWALRLSEPERPPRAVLDTDVIFSRVLYELLGRLALKQRLLTLIWSDELLAEAERVLAARKSLPAAVAAQWVGYLREAFPRERIDLGTLDAGADLGSLTSDPDDEHVCALAVAGGAELLLTFDHGYQRAELQALGVAVVDPDAYLTDLLAEEPGAVLASVEATARAWGGGRPVVELVDALARAGAELFAAHLRAAGP
jgi:predicted nucleic acid-binding protein